MSLHVLLLSVFCISCISRSHGQDQCASINSRSQWGARSPVSISYMSGSQSRIIVKETGTSGCTSRGNCLSAVRNQQNSDILIHGKEDITCSFLIGGDGLLYEGRGWDVQTEYPDSLEFCMIGTFDKDAPSNVQKSGLVAMLECASTKGKLTSSYTIQTPRDLSSMSDNPGVGLYSFVKGLPHYLTTATTLPNTQAPTDSTPSPH